MLNERWALWRVVKWLRQIFSGGEPVEAIGFDTSFANPTHTEGLVFYDNTEYAVSYYNDEAELTIHLGQDSVLRVRNATGSLISKGQAVYSNAATGNRPNIVLARADALSTARVLGVAGHDIENNTDGYVVRAGEITDIDTSSFSAGDELFLSSATAGALTNSKPTGANFAVVVGECLVSNAAVGVIVVDLRPTADAAQKSITQTVSGDWTFSDTVEITKVSASGANNSSLVIDSTNPQFSMVEDAGTTDETVYNWVITGGEMRLRTLDDSFANPQRIFSVFRTGTTVDTLSIGGTSANIDVRIYASTGTDYGALQHDSNEFFIGSDTAGDDVVFHTGGTGNPRLRLQGTSHARFYYPISIPDGSTAPSTVSGQAFIYVDTSDGDLKVKFGDGTVKTIATDT